MVVFGEYVNGFSVGSAELICACGWRDEDELLDFQTRIVRVVDGDFEDVAVKLEVRIVL